MDFKKIEGLIAAPYTPMKENGTVNYKLVQNYAEKLKGDRLSGVFICGTTGEGMLMTVKERKTVADVWINEQTEKFKVIVHVGATSPKQAFNLAKHAQKIHAYGIGCMGPMFLKPQRVEDLVSFCVEVALGAPDLPFYYYSIPSITGIDLSMKEFIVQASALIPNFAGVKYTGNDMLEMQQCLALDNSKWDILHGFDELLLAGLVFGAKGAVGSTYNFIAPLYNKIIDDFNNGDIVSARKNQLLSVRIVEILNKYGGAIPAGKALMKRFGVDCGPCRLPIRNMDEGLFEQFLEELEHLNVF